MSNRKTKAKQKKQKKRLQAHFFFAPLAPPSPLGQTKIEGADPLRAHYTATSSTRPSPFKPPASKAPKPKMSANYAKPHYFPKRLSEQSTQEVYQRRKMGHYISEETGDEALICLRQLRQSPADKVFTLIHRAGVFNVYNTHEFMAQIKEWQKQKCVLLRCNIVEIMAGQEGKATLFTIQPPTLNEDDDQTPLSPLALAFGTMVSGFSYITRDKALVELVWRTLGSKE